MRSVLIATFVTGAVVVIAARQQAPGGSPYQRFAPIDLTGTWVSVVTEDWAVRMIAPPKGDFSSLPLTRAAQDAANAVDVAQLETAGRACEAYGAPVIMREPGRVRISWADPNTLRIETDSGQQTRLLHFDAAMPAGTARSLQGYSFAEWQYAGGFDPVRAAAAAADGGRGDGGRAGGGGGGRGGRGGGATSPQGGRLKVVTASLSPGLLRKNGVPYSANATVTEYYNLLTEPNNGPTWFVVTTVVHDPANLAVDFITSTNFRKETSDAGWRPRPCTLR